MGESQAISPHNRAIVGSQAEVERVQKKCNGVKVPLLCLNCTQSKSTITHLKMYSSKSTKLLHFNVI